MSTLQVANIFFESTGNNRIQFLGSNSYTIVAGGNNVLTVNTTNMSINGSITSANLFVRPLTTNYTLTGADSGAVLTVSSTSATTITIPAGLPVGFRCLVYMINTGNVVFSGSGGVTLNSRSGGFTISQRWASASVFEHATDSIIIDGSV